ncbi:hypothetical protein SteCoe_4231 [Stentor coeruleus]|uniref:Uncharacterized protein n=1 Tax=Stentor coeruleus TaxID=5963 RepID=A0A1R2CV50_9CILI|nr:hypothetical protein SteCoe_4231 [Stentor coeruleus]
MDKFKNDPIEKLLKEGRIKKNAGSYEKFPRILQVPLRPMPIPESRFSTIRNISVRLDLNGIKSKSLLNISDSKENTLGKQEKVKLALDRYLIPLEKTQRARNTPSPKSYLQSAPKILPSFPNKFFIDLEAIESKLHIHYLYSK